jgi:hypothetical protein
LLRTEVSTILVDTRATGYITQWLKKNIMLTNLGKDKVKLSLCLNSEALRREDIPVQGEWLDSGLSRFTPGERAPPHTRTHARTHTHTHTQPIG